jgi:hypothetical protein
VPDRQIEQDGVGQLVMPHDASANLVANVRNSALERPKAMRAVGKTRLSQKLGGVPAKTLTAALRTLQEVFAE